MNTSIALFASSRRNGNTGKLIDWIASELDMGVIDISEKVISPYDYDHKNIDDDFIPLVNELLNFKNIIFATPVYWFGPSAQMKTFIDRTSDFLDVEELRDLGRKLRKKTAYVVCTSVSNEANHTFLDSLKSTFTYLGMDFGGYIHANCEMGFVQNDYLNDVKSFVSLLSMSEPASIDSNPI